jgi:tight adherence protein B
MELLEIIEWVVLAGALIVMAISLASMRRPDEIEDGEGNADDQGFGTVSRPQRIVDGAGLDLPFWLVWLFFILVGMGVALLLMDRFYLPAWLGGLIALLIPYCLWNVISEIARRRSVRFEERLIDGIDLMISVLQCGETPRKALEAVAENGEQPVRDQFKYLVRRLEYGMGMHRALRPMVRRYDSEGLRLFANTLAAKSNVGGDMVPILVSLNKVLRDRYRHRERISSQMTGSKLASVLIGLSPYVIFIFYVYRKPEWIDRIFESSLGTSLFIGAVCIQILGFVWLNRLARSIQ